MTRSDQMHTSENLGEENLFSFDTTLESFALTEKGFSRVQLQPINFDAANFHILFWCVGALVATY